MTQQMSKRRWTGRLLPVGLVLCLPILLAPTTPDAQGLAGRWGILDIKRKLGDETIVIPLGDGARQLWVLRSPGSKNADTVQLHLAKTSDGVPRMIFEYKCKGTFSVPEAQYSGEGAVVPMTKPRGTGRPGELQKGKGQVWFDMNADGRFDVVMRYHEPGMYLHVGDKWIPHGKAPEGWTKDVWTADGRLLRFDVKSGMWKMVSRAK